MEAILELIGLLISLAVRTFIIVAATPFVLFWPRADRTVTYWQSVWSRYKRVLGHALT